MYPFYFCLKCGFRCVILDMRFLRSDILCAKFDMRFSRFDILCAILYTNQVCDIRCAIKSMCDTRYAIFDERYLKCDFRRAIFDVLDSRCDIRCAIIDVCIRFPTFDVEFSGCDVYRCCLTSPVSHLRTRRTSPKAPLPIIASASKSAFVKRFRPSRMLDRHC